MHGWVGVTGLSRSRKVNPRKAFTWSKVICLAWLTKSYIHIENQQGPTEERILYLYNSQLLNHAHEPREPPSRMPYFFRSQQTASPKISTTSKHPFVQGNLFCPKVRVWVIVSLLQPYYYFESWPGYFGIYFTSWKLATPWIIYSEQRFTIVILSEPSFTFTVWFTCQSILE